jgi:hypothetical protein
VPWGRRCDLGCESWPDEDDYAECAICGEPTKRYSNLRPAEPDEARSQVLHIRFEEFYEEYCEARGQSVSGPLVDNTDEFDAELADLLAGSDLEDA